MSVLLSLALQNSVDFEFGVISRQQKSLLDTKQKKGSLIDEIGKHNQLVMVSLLSCEFLSHVNQNCKMNYRASTFIRYPYESVVRFIDDIQVFFAVHTVKKLRPFCRVAYFLTWEAIMSKIFVQ